MKKLIAALILLACSIWMKGQQYLLQQYFDQGNTLPEGWELKADSPYTSASNSGTSIPALKFSATGHYLITPFFNGATDLSFWIKGVSTDTLSVFIVEGLKDNEWIEIKKICPILRTGQKYQISLPDNVIRLRFSYIKSSGNVAFDDLVLSRPSRPPQILSGKMVKISDYTAEVEITADTSGTIAYMVVPDSVSQPEIVHMLHFDQYPYLNAIADSGHVGFKSTTVRLKLTNLTPSIHYRISLLATGSKNNTDASSKLLTLSFTTLKAQPNLFFSAIVKGKSNNKVIAIYNPTADTVDLSCYRIAMSTNGGGWSTSYFSFKPGTRLLPYRQYIIMKSTADSAFKANYPADTLTGNKVINFTGNDARALQRTVNQQRSWFTIDIYGIPNQSTNFAVAGIAEAAGNYNLFRKRFICTGNTHWQTSAGNDSISSEWILKPLDDYKMLDKPFAKPHRKLIFKSLSFAVSPLLLLTDSLQQQIYITFPDTVDLKHIVWSAVLDSNLVMQPAPDQLKDFSADFSFNLIDTVQLDTSTWTFRIKIMHTLVHSPVNRNISVYPNPVSNVLYLNGISHEQITKTEIFSSGGKKVATYTQYPLWVQSLPAGTYWIKVYFTDNESIVCIFVKSP